MFAGSTVHFEIFFVLVKQNSLFLFCLKHLCLHPFVKAFCLFPSRCPSSVHTISNA